MRTLTQTRTENTPDVLWVCEHSPVYTLGLSVTQEVAERVRHSAQGIPVIATDRGGQTTYHGPGQVVAYPLLDLKRRGYFVKAYVYRLEEALLKTLAHFGVVGHRVPGAPGIYVRLNDPANPTALPASINAAHLENPHCGLAKIAALGIKVSSKGTYHGVALNVAMDLEPFERIAPCGYAGLRSVNLATVAAWPTPAEGSQANQIDKVQEVLQQQLLDCLAP